MCVGLDRVMKLDAEADYPGSLSSYLYGTSYASLDTRICRHGTDSDRVSRWISTGLAHCSELIASFAFVGDLTARLDLDRGARSYRSGLPSFTGYRVLSLPTTRLYVPLPVFSAGSRHDR
jgi:hypothetical protein